MIKNTTTKRTKAKGNCWDNRLCGKPINSSSDEEELKHQLVTIFQPSTSGVPLRRRSPPKLEEIGQSRFQATGGSRHSHARFHNTPPQSPRSRHQDQYGADTTGQPRGGRELTTRRPIATSTSQETTGKHRSTQIRPHQRSHSDHRREEKEICKEMEKRTREMSFTPIRRRSTTSEELCAFMSRR